jgi:hypothetical protein
MGKLGARYRGRRGKWKREEEGRVRQGLWNSKKKKKKKKHLVFTKSDDSVPAFTITR